MSGEISPLWLRSETSTGGAQIHTVPLPLRLWLARGGCAFVMELMRDDPSVAADDGQQAEPASLPPLKLSFLSHGGTPIGEDVATMPLSAVMFPRGTAFIALDPDVRVRIGLYPRSKIGLKLHAFATGQFATASLGKRWRAAAAAARDLRGVHASLLEGSGARQIEHAQRYRHYRTHFVEDFARVIVPGPDLRLSFLSSLEGISLAEAEAGLAALERQSDADWEWIVALPHSTAPEISAWADTRLRAHPSVHVIATTGSADALNQALAAASGGLTGYLPLHGHLTRDAVACVRDAFARHADCELVYTDEERTDAEGKPSAGIFKPAWNRHLLQAHDYVGDLVVFRTSCLRALGGLSPAFGAAARYDLLLRASNTLASAAIRHLPRVAFSAAAGRERDLEHADYAGPAARAVAEATGVAVAPISGGMLRPLFASPEPPPLVSLVIPTRDRADLMGVALRSLIALTAYKNYEIVIVDNGSVEPATFALFAEIQALWPATVIVRDDGSFNYPRICNAGVAAASGSLICLLNNDIEVIEAGWLDEMVALTALPATGIVGARLLFPDRTIQHAGVIVGLFHYAAHWFSHATADAPGPLGRLLCRSNLSAVTGACLMITRACWDEVGGLDAERFAEDCNDIDLCLRVRRAGHEVVWTPFACLVHHESASRGKRRSREHRNRLKAQRKRMEELWSTRTLVDPHYNPNLARTSLHAGLADVPQKRNPRTDAI